MGFSTRKEEIPESNSTLTMCLHSNVLMERFHCIYIRFDSIIRTGPTRIATLWAIPAYDHVAATQNILKLASLLGWWYFTITTDHMRGARALFLVIACTFVLCIYYVSIQRLKFFKVSILHISQLNRTRELEFKSLSCRLTCWQRCIGYKVIKIFTNCIFK